jgi:hypothetical protein
MKKPNSKGSLYNAYKLSCIGLEENIDHQDNCIQILIGCDNDDQFNNNDCEDRLKVYIETDNPNTMTSFDLEDFIEEAKKLCPQLFKTK